MGVKIYINGKPYIVGSVVSYEYVIDLAGYRPGASVVYETASTGFLEPGKSVETAQMMVFRVSDARNA